MIPAAKEVDNEAPRRFKLSPIASRLKRTPSAMWGVALTLTLLLVAILPHIPLPKVQIDVPLFQGAVAGQVTGCTYHTVVAGETLSQLSEEYDVSVDAIAKANHIQDTSVHRCRPASLYPVG